MNLTTIIESIVPPIGLLLGCKIGNEIWRYNNPGEYRPPPFFSLRIFPPERK